MISSQTPIGQRIAFREIPFLPTCPSSGAATKRDGDGDGVGGVDDDPPLAFAEDKTSHHRHWHWAPGWTR